MGRAERSLEAAPSRRRSAIGSQSPDRQEIPRPAARESPALALTTEPAGSARAMKTRAATATHSPDTSLNGRSEVNQNRGDAAAITAASAGRNGCGSSVRHNVKTSSRSPAPASALHTARPRTSGDATPAARSSGVESLPSAMNSGYPGGCGWCCATSKSRTPSAKLMASMSSRAGGSAARWASRNSAASAGRPLRIAD